MTKIKKIIMTFTIVSALLLNFSVFAFATETSVAMPDENLYTNSSATAAPLSDNYQSWVPVSSKSWTTIATSTTGFNCNVYIFATNTAVSGTDIRMLGKNGNVLWSENNAISFNSNRIFRCGSDVYTIQARARSGSASVGCHKTTDAPN